MESILEQQRRYHEEMERLMDAKTKEMLHKKTTVFIISASLWLTANIGDRNGAVSWGFRLNKCM